MDPTHRITFTPLQGPVLVYLVRMCADDHRRLLYRDAQPPNAEEWWVWCRDLTAQGPGRLGSGWSCSGGPTPHWRPGLVVVEALQPRWQPSQASWNHSWPPVAAP